MVMSPVNSLAMSIVLSSNNCSIMVKNKIKKTRISTNTDAEDGVGAWASQATRPNA